MVCTQCGAPIEENTKFCTYCGNRFSGADKNLEKETIDKNTKLNEDKSQKNKRYCKDDISVKINSGQVIPLRRKEIAILIAVLGGIFGFHRLYLGQFLKFLMFIGDWIILITFMNQTRIDTGLFALFIFLILFLAPFVVAIRDIVKYIKMDKTNWCVKYGCREKFNI